jgi:hypothetical protein
MAGHFVISPAMSSLRNREPLASLKFPDAELVFALVYPVGTNGSEILGALRDRVKRFGYDPVPLHLSDYLPDLKS